MFFYGSRKSLQPSSAAQACEGGRSWKGVLLLFPPFGAGSVVFWNGSKNTLNHSVLLAKFYKRWDRRVRAQEMEIKLLLFFHTYSRWEGFIWFGIARWAWMFGGILLLCLMRFCCLLAKSDKWFGSALTIDRYRKLKRIPFFNFWNLLENIFQTFRIKKNMFYEKTFRRSCTNI